MLYVRCLVPLLAFLCLIVSAPTTLGDEDAVSYRTNTAHTGQQDMPDFTQPVAVNWDTNLGATTHFPLIANETVYAVTDATQILGVTLNALRVKNGRFAWRNVSVPLIKVVGMAYENGKIFVSGIGPHPLTPFQLVCFDASDGAQLWSTNCAGRYNSISAPTAYGGYVYLQSAGIVSCVRESDGSIAWPARELGTDNGALSVSASGIFVSDGIGATYSIDPTTSETLWAFEPPFSGGGDTTCAYYGGDVYIQKYVKNWAIDSSASINARTGKLDRIFPKEGPGAFDEGMKFGINSHGSLNALNISSWTNAWAVTNPTDSPITAPTCINGIVYVGTESGKLLGYSEATGSKQVSLDLPEPPSQNKESEIDMSAGDGILVIPAGTHLIAVGRPFATVTATISPGNPNGLNGWYKDPVSITLKATSGTIHYNLYGTGDIPYLAPFTLSGESAYKVAYWATDANGNTSGLSQLPINIDAFAPTTSCGISGTQLADGSYAGPVFIALSAYDGASGVSTTTFSLDGSHEERFPSPWQIGVGGVGKHILTFRSTDVAGNIEPTKTMTITIAPSKVNSFAAGLQMIGAPEDFSASNLAAIFDEPMKLAYWNGAEGRYDVSSTIPADTLHLGKGYWARVPAIGVDLFNVGTAVDTTKPYSIRLSMGWNMISDPFNVQVDVSGLKTVGSDGLEHPFGKAGSLVGDALFTYGPTSTAYSSMTSGSLQPFVGYWIYAHQDCTLVVPAVPGQGPPPPPV